MKKLLSFFTLLLFIVVGKAQQTVPPDFYSINGWMPDYVGQSTDPGNGLGYTWYPAGNFYNVSNTPSMQSLKVRLVRYGGTSGDINFPTTGQMNIFVNHVIYDLHAEPLIQIPFLNQWFNDGNVTTLTSASNVSYLNNVAAYVTYLTSIGVKYYSIGNEPDLYPYTFNKNGGAAMNASQIADYFKAISDKIKLTNPNAIVFGPDLASPHSSNFDLSYELIGGSADITATSGISGKPYCDVYSVHTYPFPMCGDNNCLPANKQHTRALVISHPVTSTTYALSFQANLNNIRSRIHYFSNNPNLKLAITEFNIAYENQTATSTVPGSNGVPDQSCRSFIAGQWMAEMMAIALVTPANQHKVDYMFPWSVIEGGGGGLTDHGLYEGSTTTPRSTYQHYKLMSTYFTGQIFMGTTTNSNVKAFVSKSCGAITIMVLNQNTSTAINSVHINLTSTPPTLAAGEVGINIPCAARNNILETIAPEETLVIVCDPCGTPLYKIRYNKTINTTFGNPTAPVSYNSRIRCACYEPPSGWSNALKCVPDGSTGPRHFQTQVLNTSTIIGDSAWVLGEIKVPNNTVLTIENAEVNFSSSASIVVQPGGKLIIKNSYLHACQGQTWGGISIKGNNNNTTAQLIIEQSKITDAVVAVSTDKTNDVSITETIFSNGTTAIEMNKAKGFIISKNQISQYVYGIKTANTLVRPSLIKENSFTEVKYAVNINNDNHSKLDLLCNYFDYTHYAILSTNSILKDQGTVIEGAGNEFNSSSTLVNNKLSHTGNAITYYVDPSSPITSGMNVTTSLATSDGCLASGVRMAHGSNEETEMNNVIESISKREINLISVPNPNSGNATIYFGLGEGKQGELTIMDIYGKVVDRIKLNSESNKVDVDYTQFANGIYLMSVTNENGEMKTRKMIIAK